MQTIVIDAPPERVWQEITKLRDVNRALMDSVFDTTLEPGAPVLYRTEDGKRVFIVGRILEVEPPRRLVMRWQLTMRKDPPTTVTWTLDPEGNGTRVTVEHVGFPDDTKLKGYDSTWAQMLSNLKAVIEDGRLPLGVRMQYGFFRLTRFAMPSSTRPERVAIPD